MPGPVSQSMPDRTEGEVLTCAYCGLEYPLGTKPSRNEALHEHIKQCPEHPLKQAYDKIVDLERELVDLRIDRETLTEKLTKELRTAQAMGYEEGDYDIVEMASALHKWAIDQYYALCEGGKAGRPMDLIDSKTWAKLEKARARFYPLTKTEKERPNIHGR